MDRLLPSYSMIQRQRVAVSGQLMLPPGAWAPPRRHICTAHAVDAVRGRRDLPFAFLRHALLSASYAKLF
jgi:hypothetical protein